MHDIGSSPIHMHTVSTGAAPVLGYSGPNADGGAADLSLAGWYANTGMALTPSTNPFTLEFLYWNWQALAEVAQLFQTQSVIQVSVFKNATQWAFTYNGVVLNNNNHFTAQKWHHFAATYDGVNMRFYVDSILAGPQAVAPQVAVSFIPELSTNVALSTWGKGFYSEVAMYNAALSGARIGTHFASVDNVSNVPVAASSTGVAPDFAAAPAAAGAVAQADLDLIYNAVHRVI